MRELLRQVLKGTGIPLSAFASRQGIPYTSLCLWMQGEENAEIRECVQRVTGGLVLHCRFCGCGPFSKKKCLQSGPHHREGCERRHRACDVCGKRKLDQAFPRQGKRCLDCGKAAHAAQARKDRVFARTCSVCGLTKAKKEFPSSFPKGYSAKKPRCTACKPKRVVPARIRMLPCPHCRRILGPCYYTRSAWKKRRPCRVCRHWMDYRAGRTKEFWLAAGWSYDRHWAWAPKLNPDRKC